MPQDWRCTPITHDGGAGVDQQFSFDRLETIVDERPVIARLMVGTIGATAALMVIGIHWASTDASVVTLLLGAAGITLASALLVLTVLPIECKFGPGRHLSIPCRLQARRLWVDTLALAVALLVIVNLFVTMV
jgi:hypothetical protein